MMKFRMSALWPNYLKKSQAYVIISKLLFLFLMIFPLTSPAATAAQEILDEGEEDFRFLFAGYSSKRDANETFFIETQDELDRVIQEMGSSEYIQFFHDLLPERGRIDFMPFVDFDQETVIAVVGKLHNTPCRKTKIIGVKKDRFNDLSITLEETFSKACKSKKSTAHANPVILIKVKRPVAGLKSFREFVRESIEE